MGVQKKKKHPGHSANGAVGQLHLGHQCLLFSFRSKVPTDHGNVLHYWFRHLLIPVREGESVGTEDSDRWRFSRSVLSLFRDWCHTYTNHRSRTGILLCYICSATGDWYEWGRYNIYTQKTWKLLRIMLLPPTEKNLLLHISCTNLLTILSKSADQQAPPELDIIIYGWEITDGTLVPATSDHPPGPKDLIDVVCCNRKQAGKTCDSELCSCHHEKISCTVYCTCIFSDACLNPFKTGDVDQD